MRKRILSLLLVVILVVGMLPNAVAANGYYGEQIFSRDMLIADPMDLRNTDSPGSGSGNDDYRISDDIIDNHIVDQNEMIFVIVELYGDPIGADAAVLSETPAGVNSDSVYDMDIERARVRQRQSNMIQQHNDVLTSFSSRSRTRTASLKIASYTVLFNGFAMQIRRGDIAELKKDSRVKEIYISEKYDIPEPQESYADTGSNYSIGTETVWNAGYEGDGMLVAVIDTGIDYTHPQLSTLDSSATDSISKEEMIGRVSGNQLTANNITGDNFYKNEKVIYGYNYSDQFLGGLGTPDPVDYDQHGTHVAGIAAATPIEGSTVIGVAPNAQIMSMRVFPYSYDHVILMAIEDAVTLGADAINLSLGTTAGYSDYSGYSFTDLNYTPMPFSYDDLFERANAVGCILAVAAGNDSYVGLNYGFNFYQSSLQSSYAKNVDYGLVSKPSVMNNAMSVASTDNAFSRFQFLTVNGDSDNPIYYSTARTKPSAGMEEFSIRYDGEPLQFAAVAGFGDTVQEYTAAGVSGKIALIQRGGSVSFATKMDNAAAAGAIGCIIYNNIGGIITSWSLDGATSSIPCVGISMEDGLALVAMSSGTTLTFNKNDWGVAPLANGGRISVFSSYGTTGLKIKPDITAPGGNILSTYPVIDGSYDSISGTSMASPHVAGASILLKQYVKEKFNLASEAQYVELVENLMASTAIIVEDSTRIPYPVQAQGAGQIDLAGAVNAEAIVYNTYDHKTKVELWDNLQPGNISVSFMLQNFTDSSIQFVLSSMLLTDDYNYFLGMESVPIYYNTMKSSFITTQPDNVIVNASGNYSDGIISLGANGIARVTVTFSISSAKHLQLLEIFKNGYYVDGFIKLSPVDNNSYELSIPFLGFVGNWNDVPVFDKSLYEIQAIQERDGYIKADEINFYTSAASNRILRVDGTWNGEEEFAELGTNWFDIGTDEQNWPKRLDQFMSFSPNGDGYADCVAPFMHFLRNARGVTYTITDSNDQIVWQLEDSYYAKAYVRYGSYGYEFRNIYNLLDTEIYGMEHRWYGIDERTGQLVPDGEYTYTVSAALDYSQRQNDVNAKPHEWSTTVFVDTEKPTATMDFSGPDNNGKYWLTVTGHDNFRMAAIAVYDDMDFKSRVERLSTEYFYNAATTSTMSPIDITHLVTKYGSLEATKNHIFVEVGDYAVNVDTIFYEEVYTDKLEITRVSTDGVTNAPVNGFIDIFFNSDITAVGNVYLSSDGNWTSSDALSNGFVSGNRYSIPYANLDTNTVYTLKIEDFIGVGKLKMDTDTGHSFKTAATAEPPVDQLKPQVMSVSPKGASVDVSANELVVTFNKTMDNTFGTIAIDNGALVEFAGWRNQMTVVYTLSGLTNDQVYNVTIDGFKDSVGNVMNQYNYSFSTGTMVDMSTASLVSFGPTGSDEPLYGVIRLKFDKTMITNAGIVTVEGRANDGTSDLARPFMKDSGWSEGGTVYSIVYMYCMFDELYEVTLNGFKDAWGNEIAPSSFTFRTMAEPNAPGVYPDHIDARADINSRAEIFMIYYGDSESDDYATNATTAADPSSTGSIDLDEIAPAGPKMGYVTLYGRSLGDVRVNVTFTNTAEPGKLLTQTDYIDIELAKTTTAPLFDIIVTTDGNGTATANVSQSTNSRSIQLTATPAQGYKFKQWVWVKGNATINTTTNKFNMPISNVWIRAEFEPVGYNITVSSNNPSFGTAAADKETAVTGEIVTLTPSPEPNYRLVRWDVVNAPSGFTAADIDANHRFVMPNGDVRIEAVFELTSTNKFNVTVQNDGHGSAGVDIGGSVYTFGQYEPGDEVQLKAIANVGFIFNRWTVVSGNLNAADIIDGMFTMPYGNVTVKAVFEYVGIEDLAKKINVTMTPRSGGGTYSSDPYSNIIMPGVPVTLTARPSNSYAFSTWGIDPTTPIELIGGTQLTDPVIKFIMPEYDVNLTLLFEVNDGYMFKITGGVGGRVATQFLGGKTEALIPVNEYVFFEVIPNQGYKFKEWQVTPETVIVKQLGNIDEAIFSITMPAHDVSVHAVFEPTEVQPPVIVTYPLELLKEGDGTVNKNPNKTEFEEGTSVTVFATKANGFVFKEWQVVEGGPLNITTGNLSNFYMIFKMPANKVVIKAIFVDENSVVAHNLTTQASVGGTLTSDPSSGSMVRAKTNVYLYATPNSGYRFDSWEVIKGSVSFTYSSDNGIGGQNALFQMPDEDVTVKAIFVDDSMPVNYTLDVTSDGNGSVTKSPNLNAVAAGTSVSISAIAGEGYRFTEWQVTTGNELTFISGGLDTADATFIMPEGNVSIKAMFESSVMAGSNTVTVLSGGGGAVSKIPAADTVDAGTPVTITATPNQGYHFVEWQITLGGQLTFINGGITSAIATFTMPDNPVTLTAIFEADQRYDVTIQQVAGGTATASPNNAAAGSTIMLTAIANPNYTFGEWIVNYGNITLINPNSATATFIMPSSDVTITPVFNYTPGVTNYNVNITVVGNGTASANPSTAAEGTTVTLTAAADAGWHFDKWEIVSGLTGLTGNSFRMPATNVYLRAVFAEDTAAAAHSVTVTVQGSGTATANPTSAKQGTLVTLSANAAQGWHFVNWTSGQIVITNNTFVMPDADVNVTAVFAEDTVTPTQHTVRFWNGSTLHATRYAANGSSLGINWPETPYANDYRFNGWFTGTGTQYTGSTAIWGSVDLYVSWTYTGGTPASNNQDNADNQQQQTTPSQQSQPSQPQPSQTLTNVITQSSNGGQNEANWEIKTGTSVTLTDKDIANLTNGGIMLQVTKGNMTAAFVPGFWSDIVKDNPAKVEISMTPANNTAANKLFENVKGSDSEVNKKLREHTFDVTIKIDGKEVTKLQIPIILTIDLSGVKLSNEEIAGLTAVRLYGNGKVDYLGDRYDPATRTLTTEISHLSSYGVMYSDDVQKLNMTIGSRAYTINGAGKTADVAPMILDDRTLVPARFFAEAFGAEVTWNDYSKSVTIKLDGRILVLVIDQMLPGMNVPARLIDDRTMVPLRYIAENLGINVIYDSVTKMIRAYR